LLLLLRADQAKYPQVKLNKCGHCFHKGCIAEALVRTVDPFLNLPRGNHLTLSQQEKCNKKCPICSTIYGIITGSQPEGTMNISRTGSALPGFAGCGTIVVRAATGLPAGVPARSILYI